MNWKNLSYIKKGALIGGIIGLLNSVTALILLVTASKVSGIYTILTFPSLLINIFLYFNICGYEGPVICENSVMYISIILSLIILIGIGALIGLAVKKLKKN